jgi:hypothetical protein
VRYAFASGNLVILAKFCCDPALAVSSIVQVKSGEKEDSCGMTIVMIAFVYPKDSFEASPGCAMKYL